MVESAVLDCGFLGADPRALSFCSDFPRPERSFNVAPLQGRLDQVDTPSWFTDGAVLGIERG